ncbi:MAG: LysR family transcriptional regulator [Pseudomonadota bacterium]
MHNWSELRTAYYVAKYGTVSEAAEKLGIHRATVKRHIDALETKIEKKLFIRHNKGYVPTEFGLELLSTAEKIDMAELSAESGP